LLQLSIAGFIVIWLTVVLLIVLYMKRLKRERNLFDASKLHVLYNENPLYGLNTNGILPIPKSLSHQDLVVMIVDPLCKTCHTTVQSFIASADRHIPFVCLVSDANLVAHDEFMDRFGGEVNIATIKNDVLDRLHIDYSPVLFVVNKHGLIVRVQSPLENLLHYYKRYIRNIQMVTDEQY